MRLARHELNAYVAILILTIVASVATLLIVHVGTADVSGTALGNEVRYQHLQQSILKNK